MQPTVLKLAALAELPDYRVCADDDDPRGWNVYDTDADLLGSVEDLIIDLEALTARYIVCRLARGARFILVPTGFARIDNERRAVHIDFIRSADVERLPSFGGLPLSAEFCAQMEKALTGVPPTTERNAQIVRRSDETRNAS